MHYLFHFENATSDRIFCIFTTFKKSVFSLFQLSSVNLTTTFPSLELSENLWPETISGSNAIS